MTLYGAIFYMLAILVLVTTGVAITRRNLVHAVVYLVISFFGSAMLFYLLGAPFLAALEIIVYAGAIMVLFLFIIMMIKAETAQKPVFGLGRFLLAGLFGLIYLAIGAVLIFTDPVSQVGLQTAAAAPRDFGRYLFESHWLAIEVVSLLLLVALMGAFYIGKLRTKASSQDDEEMA